MAQTVGDAQPSSRAKPTIQVPPRGSVGFLYANGSGPGFSPGPMTLVSSFFPEQSPFSFSQLLAGAMASPLAAKPGFPPAYDSWKDGKEKSICDAGSNSEAGVGRKWDRPVNLVVPPPPQLQVESMGMSPLFMVPPGLSPSGLMSPLQSPFSMSHQQALAHVTAQAALSHSIMHMQEEFQHSSSAEAIVNHSSSAKTEALTQQKNPSPLHLENTKKELAEVSQSSKAAAGDKPANDGYNWRKYGQKHVKASECPRSYYKCTHPNCPVKKKVERSLNGHISEITYKGQHNHDPPKPTKREKDSSVLDTSTNSQANSVLASEDQIETERLNENQNFATTSQQSFDPCAVANHKKDVKEAAIVVDEGDADEPAAKRRTLDIGQSVPASSHQAVPDSKIVLQTRSEVDLLDDGYKWRKYGQKVVKGNPHPRSYYRCTYAGCNVRKHVERASADPKSVITTYEGKHNHDIPIGKHGSSHGAATQHPKTQKVAAVSKDISESGYGNKDQIPTTLQLKEEQIAA
uniref:WRKY protein n=1 Tax=Salvia miltiorrhiza TaxID=226208 RepID=A0A0D5Y9A7_SALMI|nr:WRKY protein [Salvia miltiorrhiza]